VFVFAAMSHHTRNVTHILVNNSTAITFALSQECDVLHCARLCRAGCAVAVLFLAAMARRVCNSTSVHLASRGNTCHDCVLYLAFRDIVDRAHSAGGLCSAELGPKTPLNRPCSSCNAGCTKNQHRGPFLLPFRGSIIVRFSLPPRIQTPC
jgi:hypothetical protein